tara:strand:- start:85 stop:528 length:444 start_codon:yes stop_codon:yes gene_type:complete
MTNYHFYEAEKKDVDEMFEVLHEFEKEAPALGYPNIDRAKLHSRILYFIDKGKIIMVKDLEKEKLIGLAIIYMTEFLWSNEELLNIQTIYVLKEYRSFALFNEMMKIIKKQANEKPIHMSISTKLIAEPLMKRAGFENMGAIWRLEK